MSFGGQTVTFVSYVDGPTPGELGTYPQVEVAVPVPGCRHRPMTYQETAEFETNVATEVWKTTAPPMPAVLSAQPDGVLRVEGVDYRIIAGPRHHRDMAGRPFKVTIISERTIG